MSQRFRSRTLWTVGATVVASLVVIAFPAAANATTVTGATTASGSADLGTLTASYDDGTFNASASLATSVHWSQPSLLGVSFDPNNVRQGRHLDPQDTFTATGGAGTMTASYAVSASAGFTSGGTTYDVSFGPVTFTASGPCQLAASGGDYTCDLSSDSVTVFQGCPDVAGESTCPLSPEVTAQLVATATITPDGAHTLRTATIGGNPAGTSPLVLSENPTTDAFTVPCTAPTGDNLQYQLGDYALNPAISLATSLQFAIKLSSPVPPIPDPFFPYITVASPSVPITTGSGTLAMSGSGTTIDMGSIQHNNVPPVLTTPSSYSGDEGSAIQFSASATGPCAAGATYAWHFSDGGTAFGANPKHTFNDGGNYSGTVTVTDTTGLTASQDFSVAVNDLPPVVNVLPASTTVPWGRNLTIQAQATAAGSDEQSTLTYAWNFGDSTPVVIGGPSETHSWPTPGAYDVSVVVCTNDNLCTTGHTAVTVRKRSTTVAYTGSNAGTYSAQTTLSGSLVDEFGNAVNGENLSFSLNAAAAGWATTGASGVASLTVPVGLSAGTYPVRASFAGDAMYTASDSAVGSYSVSAMATSLTYTGAVTGKPNGTVPLSVTLTDALGRPLAGQTVVFQLGAQTTGAVTTNGSGVAATSLKLTQKPGSYPLTVSFAGVSGQYNASNTATVFKLNSK
jgi:hypothetical protein